MVVVVGAGVAGLACARELARRGVPAIVLDRARGVGGRCATRVIEGQPVDFGLPLLHAGSREFGFALDELPEAGRVPGWPRRVREPRLACQPDAYRTGHRRMARHAGVNEFARHLATGLDVRTSTRVTTLDSEGARVSAIARDGRRYEAPFVVLATEPVEALALAEPLVSGWPGARDDLARLAALPVVRTLTVMAGYPPSAPGPRFDVWYPLEATMVHTIVHDSSKRAEPTQRVLVLQAREAFSDERWEHDDESWARELLWETGELLGRWAERPLWHRSHRWHCARVRRGHSLGDTMNFESPDGGCVSLCGDAFAAANGVEGAYLSGVALAERIATLPRVREALRGSGED